MQLLLQNILLMKYQNAYLGYQKNHKKTESCTLLSFVSTVKI